jgi:hypothetical protein
VAAVAAVECMISSSIATRAADKDSMHSIV